VVLTPQTQPVLQSKDGIEYIYRKADEQSIHLLPLGATTKNLEGKELSELYDMHQSGAVGFYNGKNSIENPNVQKLALLYARTFNAPVFTFPNQKNLSENGQMNEGETSTYLGLKGLPSLSEEITIQRDIYLCEYCESAIHFTSISSAKSVELIREAKARGLNVTCDVNLYNLVLTDEELTSYDTRYKVLPPLRTNDDRLALIEGLKDGTIDAIAVDHIPQDIELKKCEFEHAAFGMRGLETALGLYGKQLAETLGWENWVNWISHNPRNILGSSQISINNGSIAELTLFNPNADWKIDIKSLKPTSENNPFYKSDLKGKAFGIVNKGKLVRS
ncbi:MAG: dihydroorotase, partial [Schleiferiaceae bacterium]|nr:dihydroorotase [Schleiferiaceae bacterium]